MKKRNLFNIPLVLFTFGLFAASCTEETPMTVAIDASQLQIEGNCASKIHADTAKIVFQRDSLPIAGRDTVYVMHTVVTLLLDSTYFTDQMNTVPDLRLMFSDGTPVTTLQPTDSLLRNTLINFVTSTPGVFTTIGFRGEITRSAMLRLSKKEGKALFTGFSFQYADPEIARRVDEFYQAVMGIVTFKEQYEQRKAEMDALPMEKRAQALFMLMGIINNAATIGNETARFEKKMTERQHEKYLEAAEILKKWLD